MFVGKRLGFPESKALEHTFTHHYSGTSTGSLVANFSHMSRSAETVAVVVLGGGMRRKHTSHTQHLTQLTSVDRPHEHKTVNMSCIKTEEDCCVSCMLQILSIHSFLPRNPSLEANRMHTPLHYRVWPLCIGGSCIARKCMHVILTGNGTNSCSIQSLICS